MSDRQLAQAVGAGGAAAHRSDIAHPDPRTSVSGRRRLSRDRDERLARMTATKDGPSTASQRTPLLRSAAVLWIGLALSAAMVLGWQLEQLAPNRDAAPSFAPDWLPLVAAAFATVGILPLDRLSRWRRVPPALRWTALLLLVWAANGLPFDLLTMAGLIGHRTASGAVVMSTVYWPGLATRAFALAAAVVLARLTLARPATAAPTQPASWYGYAAFVLALPYPVLRMHWALGGTLGLSWAGAAGRGWEPLLIAVPWVLAAVLSLLLVSPRAWIPRWLLLGAGWSATAIVAMIGPSALWSVISATAVGGETGSGGIAFWVFALFYGSWFLWAIAAGAATRSYQVRSAATPLLSST